jgi:hypothetical protein
VNETHEVRKAAADSRLPDASVPLCPAWCVTAHDPALGEDDWVHVSEPVVLAAGVLARLCMTVDPGTGAEDGPYVLVGDEQYTPAEATALGADLIALARVSPGPAAASGRRSAGP